MAISSEERFRHGQEKAYLIGRVARLSRALSVVLTELGADPDKIRGIVEDVQGCDFTTLGQVLQKHTYQVEGCEALLSDEVNWCLATKDDKSKASYQYNRQLFGPSVTLDKLIGG